LSNRKDEHRTVNLVVLYHEDDNEFKSKLRDHLSVLERDRIISIWDTALIFAGAELSKEINKHLELADIVLFLVSSSSIASQQLWDNELKIVFYRQQNEELILIPIKARAFDLGGSGLEKYKILPPNGQPIDSWGKDETPYVEIKKEIARICEEVKLKSNNMPGENRPNPEFYELEQSFISLPDLLATLHPKFKEYVVKSHTMAHFTIFKEQLSDIRIRMKNRRRNFTGGNMGDIDLVIELLKDINERLQKQKPEFIKKYWKDVESTIADAIQIRKEISKTNYNDPEEMDYAVVAYIYPLCEKIEEFEILCSQMAKHSIIDSMGPIHLN